MKKYIFISIALFLFLMGMLGINSWLNSAAIMVAHPMRGPAIQAVYATGTVEATVMMPISSRIAGRLSELNTDEGSNVQKGQVLAQLEDEDLQNSIRQLKAQEDFAKKAYDRNAAMVKNSYVSKFDYDRSKSVWEAAKAATAKAIAEANFMKLIAPADGLIIKRDGEIGQLIPAGEPVLWLSCCAPLRISAEVDEEDIAQVKAGQEVLIRTDAFPGKIFHAKVQGVTPKGDPVARSYRVRIEFTEDTPLRIGMTAETNIIVGETKDALLIPSSAISQGKIWKVVDGRLVQKTITTGAKGPEQTEIKTGVTQDDLVVIKPDSTFKEGRKIHSSLTGATKP